MLAVMLSVERSISSWRMGLSPALGRGRFPLIPTGDPSLALLLRKWIVLTLQQEILRSTLRMTGGERLRMTAVGALRVASWLLATAIRMRAAEWHWRR